MRGKGNGLRTCKTAGFSCCPVTYWCLKLEGLLLLSVIAVGNAREGMVPPPEEWTFEVSARVRRRQPVVPQHTEPRSPL